VDIKIEGAKDLTIESAKSQLILAAKTISLGNGNTDILTLDKQNGMQVSANAKLNCQLVQAKSKKEEQASKEQSAKEDKEGVWKFDCDPLNRMQLRGNSKSNTFGPDVRIDLVTHKPKAHQGVDLTASIGTPIKAVADGIVVSAENKPNDKAKGSFGSTIVIKFIKNGSVYYAKYCHLSQLGEKVWDGKCTKTGNKVIKGEILGKTGKSGNAWNLDPHLHFELNIQNYWPIGCPPRIDPFPHFNAHDKKMEVICK
jgi:murein DD-endopeptidase MepM/ murein hydrolase activator NlpD